MEIYIVRWEHIKSLQIFQQLNRTFTVHVSHLLYRSTTIDMKYEMIIRIKELCLCNCLSMKNLSFVASLERSALTTAWHK